jgi:hypothetical protein
MLNRYEEKALKEAREHLKQSRAKAGHDSYNSHSPFNKALQVIEDALYEQDKRIRNQWLQATRG